MAKKQHRRTTEVIAIDSLTETRVALGCQSLIRNMSVLNCRPEPGTSIHILTKGNIDLLSHVYWVLRYWPKLKRIFISCWAISGSSILLLKKLVESKQIGELTLVVGHIYPKTYRQEWAKITELHEKGIFKNVYYDKTHSKCFLIEEEGGVKIVIEASANCNINRCKEQSIVTVSDELFDFYKENLFDDIEKQNNNLF